MAKKLLIVVSLTGVLAFVLVLAVVYGFKFKMRSDYREIRDDRNRELAKWLPAIEEDQRLVGAEPFFATSTATRDAGPFLNPRVAWTGDEKEIAAWRARQQGPPPLFTIPDAVQKKVDSWPKGSWVDHAADIDYRELPLDLFVQLAEYDHWDIERNSPLADFIGTDPFEAPLIDPMVLQRLARLRLMQALQEGSFDRAAGEVDQLARLLHSTETLIGAISAIAVLGLLDRAQMKLVAGSGTTQYRRVLSDTRQRARRLAYALPSLATLDAPAEIAGRVLGGDRIPFGRCAAFNEGMWFSWFARPLLRDEMPERYAELDRLLKSATGCRLRQLRRHWSDPSLVPPDFDKLSIADKDADQPPAPAWSRLTFVPGVKSAIGYILAAIAAPDRFKYYRSPGLDEVAGPSSAPATAPAAAPATAASLPAR